MTSEQITKEPLEQKVAHVKDPKKIAAGKRLAQYHKRAKEALDKDNESNDAGEVDSTKSKWMPELSLTTGLTIIGITLSAVDLYFRFRKTSPSIDTIKTQQSHIRDIEHEPEPVRISTRSSKIPMPRHIGME